MKANDIQIGDWLYSIIDRYDHIEKKLCKVTGIRTDSDTPLIQCDDTDVWYLLDSYEPVPLTAEILEKNGFEKTQIHDEKQDDIFQCYDGEIIIEVGIYDPNFILIHYRYEPPDGINSGELSSIVKVDGGKFYLHELQHALRLCGIKKEIIL